VPNKLVLRRVQLVTIWAEGELAISAFVLQTREVSSIEVASPSNPPVAIRTSAATLQSFRVAAFEYSVGDGVVLRDESKGMPRVKDCLIDDAV
jgi:hypothetical protein